MAKVTVVVEYESTSETDKDNANLKSIVVYAPATGTAVDMTAVATVLDVVSQGIVEAALDNASSQMKCQCAACRIEMALALREYAVSAKAQMKSKKKDPEFYRIIQREYSSENT